MADKIIIKGARVHNLKNINVEIPKNKLVVITGLSGSGKSSLAFDTIYAEGQRRYAESLSSFARQFMDVRDKPDVDSVEGLSPTIAIGQKSSSQNPRSTVGTITEIYDYLRLLFARVGAQYCPGCGVPVMSFTPGQITEEVRKMTRNSSEVWVLSPLTPSSPNTPSSVLPPETSSGQALKGGGEPSHAALLDKVEKSGFDTVRVNGELMKLNEFARFGFLPNKKYNVELVVGNISTQNAKKQPNIAKMVETALDLSNGSVIAASYPHPAFPLKRGREVLFSTEGLCAKCGKVMPAIDMRSFSFNSPYGACPRCTGLGVTMEVDPELVAPNKRLTLAEGAIQPWTRITGNQTWYQKILAAVAQKHDFSLNAPVAELSDAQMKLILYGDNETYEIDGKKTVFSGVITNLTQRHLETDSDYVRGEIEQYMREQVCSLCHGKRLRVESLAVKLGQYSIADISELSAGQAVSVLEKLSSSARGGDKWGMGGKVFAQHGETIIKETIKRLQNLQEVGLGYLSLGRAMNTLSGGEVTRVRLAGQLSSGLTGIIYILDEPSVGLHPKDNAKLIGALKFLRDLGNTVIVVEHDSAMMAGADYLIDMGPGAGLSGGEIVAAGSLQQIKKNKKSVTGKYLVGRGVLPIKMGARLQKSNKKISILGARAFNLKNVDADIPLGKFVCVTGVSGSGKSSLIVDILGRQLARHFYRAKDLPGEHKKIKGIENIDKVITVDQSPIGRTPRSNPATYTGLFTLIRDLFAGLPEAKMNGYDAGKFSFNVKGGGRCEACAGEGYVRIPMQFLADVYMQCNECGGDRYNREALEIHYRNKNIADVLRMTVDEAFAFFNDVPPIAGKLGVLREIGLGYVQLGQPATTVSGGEAQRIKLSAELSRSASGHSLYILDEPTTGLHFEDIKHLLEVLNRLVAKGNTVLVIEHNLDVIRSADWVIDMGPEGGDKGGEIVAAGAPRDIMKSKKSWTGKYLKG
ncbi:excinuclease ABC subunit UvrA [Patescibacteria group bacterium]|nr:MAG: excinuclease ABC subunit UvrA [Patescibacteria group bacterium]